MNEALKQYLPKDYKRRAYYTPFDVAIHNTANDLWVSFFGKVWDLT
jgi:cytochrome b involved in lipid metabolism